VFKKTWIKKGLRLKGVFVILYGAPGEV